MSCHCFIVPPHLLKAIAASTHNSEDIRKTAQHCVEFHEKLIEARRERLAVLTQPRGARGEVPALRASPFIPEGVLEQLSIADDVDEVTRTRAKRDLEHAQSLISAKGFEPHEGAQSLAKPKKGPKDAPYRAVYDAERTTDEDKLPGTLKRAEGQPKNKDKAVNEAYDNVGAVLKFYKEKYKWNSIDNKNCDVISSVHFGESYENAFWDPDRLQMVFGDGGEFLNNFTNCVDVIGHELTHAVTEHTSPLDYQDQPGALNEHISDVFGIMIKQLTEDEKADKADWLIGEGCLLPDVKGLALRSMKAPGTAYNDPRFGKDPQVDNMINYEKTYEDNGGVHIFSGIPNKAFYLASVAFGGYSWEKAGQIWWKAMNSGKIPARCSFKQFADVTVDCAEEEFGEDAARIVRDSWLKVGVTRSI
ncbi:peptidase M4, thermolysin [Pochonia chlamydosporia 170]|uniref:Peptidase M4, thermolysin n=1 Tax=Pochonia chlamydosporia 170 TaxID=1380566 RepID=A0A179G8B8_METCM|nr:peptidase M4, thermolysin [Pochonia chlamydosporia 170]OAQ74047.1 peptidase M4, thermolysin [Pochonia chlamydosporia 170]